MAKTTSKTMPNKESVRRICLLSGGSFCYILLATEDDSIAVLSDIKADEIANCEKELQNWCGMKFRVYSTLLESTGDTVISCIQKQGEKLWPIEHDDKKLAEIIHGKKAEK